jgi:hypothetical protein
VQPQRKSAKSPFYLFAALQRRAAFLNWPGILKRLGVLLLPLD